MLHGHWPSNTVNLLLGVKDTVGVTAFICVCDSDVNFSEILKTHYVICNVEEYRCRHSEISQIHNTV